MASEKILNLIRALKKGTEEKRVHWQDLPDEQMFRTQMAGGLVRIGIIEVDERTGYSLLQPLAHRDRRQHRGRGRILPGFDGLRSDGRPVPFGKDGCTRRGFPRR